MHVGSPSPTRPQGNVSDDVLCTLGLSTRNTSMAESRDTQLPQLTSSPSFGRLEL